MSGIKRTIKETDPDYEDLSVALPNKRHKAIENSGRKSPTLGQFFKNSLVSSYILYSDIFNSFELHIALNSHLNSVTLEAFSSLLDSFFAHFFR